MDTTSLDRNFFSYKTKPSYQVFCHVNYSHSSIPSIVKNRQRDVTSDQEESSVFSDDFIVSSPAVPLGLPVYIPEKIINGLDPLKELVHEKLKWSNHRNRLIKANLENPQCNTNIENSDRTRLPIEMVKLADYLDKDPDPYFAGEYNWYYTDGNLKTISLDNFKLLASSRFSVPGVIILQSIRHDEENKESLSLVGSETSLHTGSTQHLLQISSYNNIIASRQKNSTCLFCIESDGSNSGELCHKFESIASLTSLSIAPSTLHNGEYCTLDSLNYLKIWVPFWKNVKKAEGLIEEFSSNDNWGNAKYISENTILLANRDLICLKDVRYKLSKKNGQSWKKNHVNSCEVICNTVLSEQAERKCYVTTTHQLLELDFRKSFSKSWTHMMDSPPSLGFSAQLKDGGEIVALGSQSPGEVCCVLTRGNTIPHHLSSPNDTLSMCRSKGICLNPSLTSRCNLGISGLDRYCSGGEIFVIRQTNVGDLFYQSIHTNRDSCAAKLEIKDLESWEKQCVAKYDTLSSSVLTVSDEIDCGTLFNSISKKRLQSERLNKGKLPKRSPWNMSKKKMLQMKNSFLECLLDVWDIDNEPEWCEPNEEDLETINSCEQSGTKVSGWLDDMIQINEDI